VDGTIQAPAPATNAIYAAIGPTNYPRPFQNVWELQVVLARQGLSPGSLDGILGLQTRAALKSLQQREHLPITGELDEVTRHQLVLTNPPTTDYVVTSNDLARLQPLSPTWLGKSQQTALEYETLLELVSEKGQASPGLIRQLNPNVDWARVPVGTSIELPEVSSPTFSNHLAYLTIRLTDKVLEAWDENTNLLAHFPCSIARRVEKRPIGELHVAVIVHNPNYTFDPENFPESAEARELNTKLILPPGPNNPVGVAWIGLDKAGYGIHGTPNPEQVGRTESHGCFRLANWNARYLARLVTIGTPVYVQP
jgi:lipoprotein-anchoring transpeptidase ErfK/SrfK